MFDPNDYEYSMSRALAESLGWDDDLADVFMEETSGRQYTSSDDVRYSLSADHESEVSDIEAWANQILADDDE